MTTDPQYAPIFTFTRDEDVYLAACHFGACEWGYAALDVASAWDACRAHKREAHPDDRDGPPLCSRCLMAESTGLCCSTHGRWYCHRCYRRTHWVELCVEGCELCAREDLPMRLRLDTDG